MRTVVAPFLILAAACASTPRSAPETATAEVRNASGVLLGSVTFTAEAGGTRLHGELGQVPAGVHGLHIHAVGQCEPPFTSAGPHFNPQGRQHGRTNPQGAHAGDLPNVTADANGRVTIHALAPAPLLGEGGILDADGAALVLHENADDERTDPAGNAGARIACGVIRT